MAEGLTWPKMAVVILGQVSPSGRADVRCRRARQNAKGLTWPKMALLMQEKRLKLGLNSLGRPQDQAKLTKQESLQRRRAKKCASLADCKFTMKVEAEHLAGPPADGHAESCKDRQVDAPEVPNRPLGNGG